MSSPAVHQCQCPECRSGKPHRDRDYHHHINLLLSRMSEQQRRWFVALEALRSGHGGKQLLTQITGISPTTIRRGCDELHADLADCPEQRVRVAGGGRPAAEDRDPGMQAALEALLAPETAGDPMGRRTKGKRSSLRQLSAALTAAGHPASHFTVAKLLRQAGYSPKANMRRTEARNCSMPRDEQFRHITEQRERFETAGDPVISVDTKKKN
jgi:hypothetical protein